VGGEEREGCSSIVQTVLRAREGETDRGEMKSQGDEEERGEEMGLECISAAFIHNALCPRLHPAPHSNNPF
jgi:hypothetical protein